MRSWNRSKRASASARVLPFTLSVIIEAEAVEMAQPVPWNATSADAIAVERQVDGLAVAAERVVALGLAVGVREGVEVARPLAVVEDDFLVEIAQVGHQRNIPMTLSIAADEGIDLVARVVEAEGGARRRRQAVAVHDRLGAVVARANRDPLAVEHGADVVRVNAVENEGENASLVARRADDPEPRDRRERLRRVRQQVVLVGVDRRSSPSADT